MATFKVQIEDVVGSVGDDGALTQFLTDGAKEIINVLPRELKLECSSLTNLYIGNTDIVMDLDASGEILHVTRENADSGYHAPCRKISAAYGGMATDSGNMMYYATETDPVYWTGSDSGGDPKLFVIPTPTANQPAKIYHVKFPAVAYGDSAIVNFPDEAEYLVVLYASVKGLQRLMNNKSGSLPTLTLPPVLVAPPMSEKSVTITGTAPTYQEPVIALISKPTISDLSINTVLPIAPSDSITFTTSAPIYVSPVLSSPDYTDVNTWINTEEDSEMARVRLDDIKTKLEQYQSDIQNALNKFEEDSVEYQTQLKKSSKDGDLGAANYASKLQAYTSDVNQQVQEYQQNLTKELQLWKIDTQNQLGQYQSDIQNALNVFNKESSEYQAKLQKDLQDAQLAESKEGRDLQKYSQELASYQAETVAKVQEFTANVQKLSTDYKWLEGQYAQLKQDYNQGLQMLVGGGQPQPQKREGER